ELARDMIFVGWDNFEEASSPLWTNVEECEQAREQCYILRDCSEDWECMQGIKFEPTSVERRLGLEEDEPDHAHDLHPCVQVAHYCYGVDRSLLKRVINQRIYSQYAFEHNLNHV
ncbi:hypothetical protein PMAYCL1PPCAC_14601, partial [Pristionchus mayeri]